MVRGIKVLAQFCGTNIIETSSNSAHSERRERLRCSPIQAHLLHKIAVLARDAIQDEEIQFYKRFIPYWLSSSVSNYDYP
jgi:hypothetical protein